jgi:hypothetical protein
MEEMKWLKGFLQNVKRFQRVGEEKARPRKKRNINLGRFWGLLKEGASAFLRVLMGYLKRRGKLSL